ncbi:MAG: SusC/RagA family TonB-linked outer membrane protein [Tannerella sp.]|nr:SusC/RagA family TonB-linked outer membrane protein [Tannerella sp.]
MAVLMLTGIFFRASAEVGYSQSKRISLDLQNVTVEDALNRIEEQSEFYFLYNSKLIDVDRKVNVKARNQLIFAVLDGMFASTDVTYRVEDKQIILSHKEWDSPAAVGQNTIRVTGTVVDEKGEPVIGANILEKGTTNGTVTDVNGQFRLEAKPNAVLRISFIGYAEQEVKVSGSAPLRITLTEDSQLIDEVVVTALGIKRQEKALGYAVQTVKSDVITKQKSAFMVSALTGKMAGVKVGTGAEIRNGVRIDVRGEDALVVVDGVPHGDINQIAPEDVESITVLKGPTATAMYGSKGGNGAIMITTRRGEKDGLQVTASSTNTFEAGWLAFPTSQASYSTGTNGKYNPNVRERWGDKLDIGREALQYDPYTYTWSMQPLVSKGKNNLANFMVSPWITNDNVNVAYRGKNTSFRNSLTYVHRQANWPNSKSDRFIYSVAGSMKAGRFTLDASASIGRYHTPQEFGIGGWNIGYFHLLNNRYGAEFDIRDYREPWVAGQENIKQNWWNSISNSPYYIAYEMTSSSASTRYYAQANAAYEIASWLRADVLAGTDVDNFEKETIVPWDERRTESFYEMGRGRSWSINAQALLNFDKTVHTFRLEGFVGTSLQQYNRDGLYAATQGGLSVPGFYSLRASNGPVRVGFNSMAYWYETMDADYSLKASESQSLFGKAGVSWKNAVFLEATARNDWVSTLSESERSFFYPSVAGSISLSELIPKVGWLDFWKIRGSWTQTKSPPDIYAINQTYAFDSNIWENMPGASYPGTIRSATLRPSSTRTWETGTAAWFLNSRLKLDVAYYEKLYYDMQVDAPVSITSGFDNAKINSEEERVRKGIELTLTGDVIKTRDFTWTSAVNLDHYEFKYKKLDPVYSPKDPWISEGAYVNQHVMSRKERFDGEVIHQSGLPLKLGYRNSYGCGDPDLNWGWINHLRYKNITLGFQFDGVVGGVAMNKILDYMWDAGTHPLSDNEYRYDEVVNGLTNYVGEGVKIVSGAARYDQFGNILEDTRIFAINNVPVSYQTYAKAYYDMYEEDMRAMDWFKFREVSIGYVLPKFLAEKMHVAGAEVSIVGQNLYLWTKEIWGTDPEYGNGSDVQPPTPRQIGFNVKIDF